MTQSDRTAHPGGHPSQTGTSLLDELPDGAADGERYPGEHLDAACELLARTLQLGVLSGSDAADALATQVATTLERIAPKLVEADRCPVCASLLTSESWDIPVLYCTNDCE